MTRKPHNPHLSSFERRHHCTRWKASSKTVKSVAMFQIAVAMFRMAWLTHLPSMILTSKALRNGWQAKTQAKKMPRV